MYEISVCPLAQLSRSEDAPMKGPQMRRDWLPLNGATSSTGRTRRRAPHAQQLALAVTPSAPVPAATHVRRRPHMLSNWRWP